jgi:light-independent protochlorophyllide reductase subunit B
VLLYPETGEAAARWLEKTRFDSPGPRTVPIGVGATRDFIAEVARSPGLPVSQADDRACACPGGRPRSIRPTSPASASSSSATPPMPWPPPGSPATRSASRWSAWAATTANSPAPCAPPPRTYGVEALITDDYLEVEAEIAAAAPELILGTQMERHIGKRLGIPCAVISAPVHVQDFPARYSPQMGFEGANVIFDTWVHPLVMGLEEHLLTMFREDFEFHDAAGPLSHHGGKATPAMARGRLRVRTPAKAGQKTSRRPRRPSPGAVIWLPDAERELKKIPFFVRGKAGATPRNTPPKGRDRDQHRDALRGKGPLCAMTAHRRMPNPRATAW